MLVESFGWCVMPVATNNYDFNKAYLVLSPGQTDSQVEASQLKFEKLIINQNYECPKTISDTI